MLGVAAAEVCPVYVKKAKSGIRLQRVFPRKHQRTWGPRAVAKVRRERCFRPLLEGRVGVSGAPPNLSSRGVSLGSTSRHASGCKAIPITT